MEITQLLMVELRTMTCPITRNIWCCVLFFAHSLKDPKSSVN